LVAALAGCAAAGGGGAGQQGGGVREQAAPVWREAARCIREHGYPEFPDPVVADDGTVQISEQVGRTLEGQHPDAMRACEPILERLPAEVRERMGAIDGDQAVTPELIAERKRFAACMREHGVPSWPDPAADGSFTIGDQVGREAKGRTDALDTCRTVLRNPNGDLRVHKIN
jgi:hypothetical protein